MLTRSVRGLSFLALSAGLFLGMPSRLFAADTAPEKNAADAGDAKPDGKTRAGKSKEDKRKGPLPQHYKDLIDGEQKAKIYDIQAQHEPEIKKLRDALNAALAKRDAEVAGVLTPAQQEKLAKLQNEDKEKAEKAKKSKKAKDDDNVKSVSASDADSGKKKAADSVDAKTEK